jgi:hypothetical protein
MACGTYRSSVYLEADVLDRVADVLRFWPLKPHLNRGLAASRSQFALLQVPFVTVLFMFRLCCMYWDLKQTFAPSKRSSGYIWWV